MEIPEIYYTIRPLPFATLFLFAFIYNTEEIRVGS